MGNHVVDRAEIIALMLAEKLHASDIKWDAMAIESLARGNVKAFSTLVSSIVIAQTQIESLTSLPFMLPQWRQSIRRWPKELPDLDSLLKRVSLEHDKRAKKVRREEEIWHHSQNANMAHNNMTLITRIVKETEAYKKLSNIELTFEYAPLGIHEFVLGVFSQALLNEAKSEEREIGERLRGITDNMKQYVGVDRKYRTVLYFRRCARRLWPQEIDPDVFWRVLDTVKSKDLNVFDDLEALCMSAKSMDEAIKLLVELGCPDEDAENSGTFNSFRNLPHVHDGILFQDLVDVSCEIYALAAHNVVADGDIARFIQSALAVEYGSGR